MDERDAQRDAFEQAAIESERYVLRLYVTGLTPRSARAVNIYQQPVLTRGEQIIAAPTLIKKLPLPMRRIIGDLSNRERVLLGLDLILTPDQAHGKQT